MILGGPEWHSKISPIIYDEAKTEWGVVRYIYNQSTKLLQTDDTYSLALTGDRLV